jgi:glycosyl transferase family 2
MTELTARVVIACHTEGRLSSLKRAIVSAQNQTPPPAQVIIAVDNTDRLCAQLGGMSGIEIVDHRGHPGASGARNAGAARAHSPCSCSSPRTPVSAGAEQDLGDERAFLVQTLPRAVARDLRTGKFTQALAILADTAAAEVGAAVSIVRAALSVSPRRASRSAPDAIDTPAPSRRAASPGTA